MSISTKAFLISLIAVITGLKSFAQTTITDSVHRFPIEKKGNTYFMNGEKIKMAPYLNAYPESAYFFQKAKNNSIAGITCLGIGLTSELISLIPKSDNTRMAILYSVSLPSIVGIVYFAIETGKNRKKAIAAYNRKVIM